MALGDKLKDTISEIFYSILDGVSVYRLSTHYEGIKSPEGVLIVYPGIKLEEFDDSAKELIKRVFGEKQIAMLKKIEIVEGHRLINLLDEKEQTLRDVLDIFAGVIELRFEPVEKYFITPEILCHIANGLEDEDQAKKLTGLASDYNCSLAIMNQKEKERVNKLQAKYL